jgi:hypothetical protein
MGGTECDVAANANLFFIFDIQLFFKTVLTDVAYITIYTTRNSVRTKAHFVSKVT